MIKIISAIRRNIIEAVNDDAIDVIYLRNLSDKPSKTFITFSYTTTPRNKNSEDFYIRIRIYDRDQSQENIEGIVGAINNHFRTRLSWRTDNLLFVYQNSALNSEPRYDSTNDRYREMQVIIQIYH